MAAARLAEGDFDAARSHYADAERLFPGMARSGEFVVARALCDRGELAEADEVSATLLADTPDDRDALELQAEIRAAQGRHEEADSLYSLVIALDRDDPYGYNAFAWSLAERGRDLPRALHLVRQGRRLSPRDPYIADTEGWVLYRMGRFDEAAARLREAIDLGFEGEGVNYRLGFALEGKGARAEAEEVLRGALRKDPTSRYAERARRALGEDR
jgi:tetratricopeptide (TPR) repeat protein